MKELPQPSSGNHPSGDDGQHTCVVTFAADIDKGNCDMFHIFDDDQSGKDNPRKASSTLSAYLACLKYFLFVRLCSAVGRSGRLSANDDEACR